MQEEINSLPTTWIKAWVIWGAVVALFLLIAPIALGRYGLRELNRYEGCKQSTRTDCTPSFVWFMMTDILTAMEKAAVEDPALNFVAEDESSARSAEPVEDRTSEQAPKILAVRPTGMVSGTSGYRVKSGATVRMEVETDNAKSVEVWFVTEKNAKGEKLATLALKDGMFSGEFKAPSAPTGIWEVRAVGENQESSTLKLTVVATE